MGTQESRTSDATSNPSPFSYNPPGKWDYRLSVVVIGAAVHQPIVSRFINTFQAPDESSVFSDWRHHIIPRCCTVLLDDKRVRLELYDDGGSSSSHGALQSDSVKDRDGVIVVYDYTFTGSFELAKKIIREAVALHEVTQMKSQSPSPPPSLLLVGVNGGLGKTRKVNYLAAKEFADEVAVPLLEMDLNVQDTIEQAHMTLVVMMVHSKDSQTPR